MSRPLIAVTTDCVRDKPHYMLPWTYCAAVEKAGGLPVMLPYRSDLALIPEFVDHFDGFILSGGADLDPAAWGETYHPDASPIDPDRQKFEFALLAEIERRRSPVLGICLGSQVMNVYRGGSLHQFLPDIPREPAIEHRRFGDDWSPRHEARITAPDSHLARAIGKPVVACNSSHKQAVNRLGQNLRITAVAPDGVIEGTEDPSFPFFVGVQWHPERQHDEPDHLAIFHALVNAAKRK